MTQSTTNKKQPNDKKLEGPTEPTYPTDTHFRLVILLIGVVILMIGFIVLLWLVFHPTNKPSPAGNDIKSAEQNSEDKFFDEVDAKDQQNSQTPQDQSQQD